jgi:Acetyltransferase (GNAT) domain
LVVASADAPEIAEGCVVPLAYDNSTGWIGFFCINEPHRGNGWGKELFAAALKHFEMAGTNMVGLDAVEQQVNTYARRGFIPKGRVRLMEHPSLQDKPLTQNMEEINGVRVVDITAVPEEILVKNDLENTGLLRSRLWTKDALFSRPDTFGLALTYGGQDDNLDGLIIVRSCQHGYRFGPLYASSTETASVLLHNAMVRLEGKPGTLTAEVWLGNSAATGVFSAAGWTEVGIDYHRMWLGGRVPKEQDVGGKASTTQYAIFDAGEG